MKEKKEGFNIKTKVFKNSVQYSLFRNRVGVSAERHEDFVIDRRPWKDKRKDVESLEELEQVLHNQERSIYNSGSRALKKVIDLARSNDWEWFLTLTFDDKKVNRYDYEACAEKVKNWLKYFKRIYSPNLKYLIVPEQHGDGAWHFHGLLQNLGSNTIKYSGYKSIGKYNYKATEDSEKGKSVYNLKTYNLGWNTVTKVEDLQKTAIYLTKYITKELVVMLEGKKKYWASTNLEKPVEETALISIEEWEILQESLTAKCSFEKHIPIKSTEYENDLYVYELSIT